MTVAGHSPQRVAALDGLRGVACLLVFGVHLAQITHLDGQLGPFELGRFLANGHIGVALFFALSGMLLSLPFWRAKFDVASAPKLGRYFTNRCVRILPAYYVCLTALIIDNRIWEGTNGWSIVGLHYALAFNYADWSIFAVNPPFWTIAVEAQFYLLLPLFFVFARKLSVRYTALIAVGFALASYATHVWLTEWSGSTGSRAISPVVEYSLLAHLPHFLIGVLAGAGFLLYSAQPERRIRPASGALGWFSIAAIAIVLATPIDDWLQIPYGRYNLPFVPLLLATLIVTAPHSSSLRTMLNGFPLRPLGLISYGIYLYHLPVLHATARYLPVDVQEQWWLFGTISLGLTVAVATGSYLIIERPITRAVGRFRATRAKPALIGTVTAPDLSRAVR